MRNSVLLLMLLVMAGTSVAAEDRISYVRSVTVEMGQTQQGDVLCFLCNVSIRGTATDDVIVMGGSVEIEGTAKQDVIVIGGAIRLGSQARAEQDLIAIGGRVERADGAVLAAGADVVSKPYFYMPGQREILWRGALTMAAFNVFVALFGYLLVRRRRTENLEATVWARPGLAVLLGLIILVAATALLGFADQFGRYEEEAEIAAILMVTIVGTPGYVGLFWLLGGKLTRNGGPWVAVAVGSLVVTLLLLIPVLGAFLILVAAVSACGATAVSRFGARAPVAFLPSE